MGGFCPLSPPIEIYTESSDLCMRCYFVGDMLSPPTTLHFFVARSKWKKKKQRRKTI